MNETLKERLLALNPLRPYVWQLKLTETEYRQLERYAQTVPAKISREYASLAIIYIAEWYKREYDGNVSNPIEGVSAESLWRASGFNADVYVYKARKTLRHLESIFMLGGLPMRFILQRGDTRLLKALCRLYKGDHDTLDDSPSISEGQAVAFQNSINQQASVYAFMETLLLGDEKDVYSLEELKDGTSLANEFIKAVKAAYDEVMRDKFRLEWIVEYNADAPYMHRLLRLHLRPEEMGGRNQYLRFERAGTWHIPQLMRQRQLKVSLSFKQGSSVVGDERTRHTILWFENTGQLDTGFEAVGSVPWAILRSIPSVPFDGIDVVVTDDSKKSYVVQHIKCGQSYMQLWALPEAVGYWSDMPRTQNETAVACTNDYDIIGAESTQKPFFDKTNGLSEPWQFAFIADSVTLHREGQADIRLWNKDGYIQFAPRLYPSVLRYNSGKVRYLYNEDPEIYPEPETEEWYPALFCREDIRANHFKTRNLSDTEPDKSEIQRIEFKPFDAPSTAMYEEWTETNRPPYGRIKVRLTIKDDEKVYVALYLPSMIGRGYDVPVVRDYEKSQLIYVDDKNSVVEVPVNIPCDHKPLNATMTLTPWGNESEKAELEAILPTLIKEVYLDGKVTKYLQDGEQFVLPYLLRNRVAIHDFNRDGFRDFPCFNVGELEERGSLDKWIRGETLLTRPLTKDLPIYLQLRFGQTDTAKRNIPMMYWEYKAENLPKEVGQDYAGQMASYSILFQDMRKVDSDLLCLPPKTNNDQPLTMAGWGDWGAFTSDTAEEASDTDDTALICFDMAVKFRTYFFIFNPLFNLTEEEFIGKVYHPLKERNEGFLTEEDITNLKECAAELGFDWERLQDKR